MEAAKDGIARSFQVDAMLTRDRFVQQASYGPKGTILRSRNLSVRQSFHQAVRKPCASILCMIIVRVHTEAWIYRLRTNPSKPRQFSAQRICASKVVSLNFLSGFICFGYH
jgi:hypothetical protein